MKTQDVDAIVDIVREASKRIAHAITPDAFPSQDANGGTVDSLTEAMMGVTGGLCRIANAVESLATAVDRIADAMSAT